MLDREPVDVVIQDMNFRAETTSGERSSGSPWTRTRLGLIASAVGDLRRALANDELVLHYQPKKGISTGSVVGVEALVRWQHPQRGLVFPDHFIPMLYLAGLAAAAGSTASVLNEGYAMGSLSMTSYVLRD